MLGNAPYTAAWDLRGVGRLIGGVLHRRDVLLYCRLEVGKQVVITHFVDTLFKAVFQWRHSNTCAALQAARVLLSPHTPPRIRCLGDPF